MTLTQALEGLTEDRFCTGAFARDASGRSVSSDDTSALRWCATGWLLKVKAEEAIFASATEVAERLGYPFRAAANDSLGYKFIEALRKHEDTA